MDNNDTEQGGAAGAHWSISETVAGEEGTAGKPAEPLAERMEEEAKLVVTVANLVNSPEFMMTSAVDGRSSEKQSCDGSSVAAEQGYNPAVAPAGYFRCPELRVSYTGEGYQIADWPGDSDDLVWSPLVEMRYADTTTPVRAYRMRMHYWMVSPTEAVFGLSMGRSPAREDPRLYPVHPCRYSISVVPHAAGSYLTQPRHYPGSEGSFAWLISLDGDQIAIDGGFWGERQQWVVFADKIEPYTVVQAHNPEAVETLWHPDWPVWGPEETVARCYRPMKLPKYWWIPPLQCPTICRDGYDEIVTPQDIVPCGTPMCMVNSDHPVNGIRCVHGCAERMTPEGKRGSEAVWTAGVHAPVTLLLAMTENRRYTRYKGATVEVAAAAGVDDNALAAWPRLKGTVGRRVAISSSQPLYVNLFRRPGQELCSTCGTFEWFDAGRCRVCWTHASAGEKAQAAGGGGGVGGDRLGGL